ncbi:MAG: YfjI family protein [Shimia thalassica]|uniref:YfjI family protein n=1 Tax=Shimia thalassica TaxID=1715693 RepID=UPI003298C67C
MFKIDSAIVPFDPEAQWPDPDMSFVIQSKSAVDELSEKDFEWVFGSLAGWIKRAAETKSAHHDFVALALITVAGTIIGNTRWAVPWEGWKEPPIIWSMLVGDPSSGKSPALDAVLDPLQTIERELLHKYQLEKADWASQTDLAKIAEAEWKNQVKAAIQEGEVPPQRPASAFLEDKPIQQRVRITDATTEKIADLLSTTWRGILLHRDEMSGWLHSMDRYSGGGDRAFWLEAFGGRSFTVDRKSNPEPLQVDKLSVSVLGGIQPDKLNRLLHNSDDDGLLARFLIVYPEPVAPVRPTVLPDEETLICCFKQLMSLQPNVDENGENQQRIVHFTENAREELQVFRETCAIWEKDAGSMMKSHIGKLPGLVVRVSLILVLLDWAQGVAEDPDDLQIHKDHVCRAILYVGHHIQQHTQRAYGSDSFTEEEKNAERIARYIWHEELENVSSREIQRKSWAGLNSSTTVRVALDLLEEAGWLKRAPFSGSGRPPMKFLVNPKVHNPTGRS